MGKRRLSAAQGLPSVVAEPGSQPGATWLPAQALASPSLPSRGEARKARCERSTPEPSVTPRLQGSPAHSPAPLPGHLPSEPLCQPPTCSSDLGSQLSALAPALEEGPRAAKAPLFTHRPHLCLLPRPQPSGGSSAEPPAFCRYQTRLLGGLSRGHLAQGQLVTGGWGRRGTPHTENWGSTELGVGLHE